MELGKIWNEASTGEVALYGGSAIAGEVVGLTVVSSAVIDSLNNKSAYAPLHAKTTELQSQNQTIQDANEQHLFKGDGGRAAKAYLGRQSTANAAEIKSLQAKEPQQIGWGAEDGLILGFTLTGIIAGLAVAHGTRKAISVISSRLNRSDETTSPNGNV